MQLREIPYQALEHALPAPPYVLLKTGHVAAQERWSIVGWDPWLTWMPPDGADPLAALDEIIAQARTVYAPPPSLPCPLPMLMGALSYDLAFDIEMIPSVAIPDIALPKMILYGFRRYIIVDEYKKTAWEILYLDSPDASGAARGGSLRDATPCPSPERNFSRASYCQAVATIRTMISRGDCYQVNLSQRFVVPTSHTAVQLFQFACRHNPASMMALVDAGEFQIISTSPERLLKRSGTHCVSEPIKGTTPRSADPQLDAQLRDALKASEKNRAELAMIIDLIRNDLGRIAQTGTVRVDDLCRIESYTNVHHLVATISAAVPIATPWSAILRALFPGGSVTGCPKIQAMRVIEQLEHVRRGFYCGAIGYIDAQGGGDWNIAIRTMIHVRDQVLFHVGGGVVYDSDPVAEYEETLRKGETMFAALQVVPEDTMELPEDLPCR